jgi:hypothetical protein
MRTKLQTPLKIRLSLQSEFTDSAAQTQSDESFEANLEGFALVAHVKTIATQKSLTLLGWKLPLVSVRYEQRLLPKPEQSMLYYSSGENPVTDTTLNIPIAALIALHRKAALCSKALDLSNDNLPLIREAARRSDLIRTAVKSEFTDEDMIRAHNALDEFLSLTDSVLYTPGPL